MKLKRRERNGRYQRASAREREFAPTLVHRVKEFGDPRFGSWLGRMYLSGDIDGRQLQAGELWGELMAKYHVAIGVKALMSFNAQPSSYHPADPDSVTGQAIAKRDFALVRKAERARSALQSVGKPAEAAVRAVCERDEEIGFTARPWLVAGLNRLIMHWSLGRS
jgi:hypothetical protein